MYNQQHKTVITGLANSVNSLCVNACLNSVECALVDGPGISGDKMDYSVFSLNSAVEGLAGGVYTVPAFVALCAQNNVRAVNVVNMLKTALATLAFLSPSQLGL
jgi:hypothetical protein